MRKQEAEKLFIWAILEYNKVRADATKTEDQMIDESFSNWYEQAKAFLQENDTRTKLDIAENILILCANGEPVARSLARQYLDKYQGIEREENLL